MKDNYHELLGVSDPLLQQAYADYLALDYERDEAALQQVVCKAFVSQVVEVYHDKMCVFVARRLRGKDRLYVEDIVQNVTVDFFFSVRKNISTPQQVITKNLRSLLLTMASYKISEHFRKMSRLQNDLAVSDGEEDVESSFFEAFVQRDFNHDRRQRIFNGIKQQLKLRALASDVLHYRLVAEESFPFISHKLKISIDEAQKTMRRIAERLKKKGVDHHSLLAL